MKQNKYRPESGEKKVVQLRHANKPVKTNERTIRSSLAELRDVCHDLFSEIIADTGQLLLNLIPFLIPCILGVLIFRQINEGFKKHPLDEEVIEAVNIGLATKTTVLSSNSLWGSSTQTIVATGSGTYIVEGAFSTDAGATLVKRKMKNGHRKICDDSNCWRISEEGMETRSEFYLTGNPTLNAK